jgi:hypothetical protein
MKPLVLSGAALALLLLASASVAGRPPSYPAALAFVPDTDGDGVADLLVSPNFPASLEEERIVVRLRSGKTGQVLREFASPWKGSPFYSPARAAIGDLDGDGVTDFALGSRAVDVRDLRSAGSVALFGTATGKVFARIDGDAEIQQLGQAVAVAGDFDRDGTPDLVVGSLGSNVVRVHSGKNGELLKAWQPKGEGVYFGQSVDGGVDLSGDGVPDVLIGVPQPGIGNSRATGRGPGRVVVQSGADDEVVLQANGRSRAERFGEVVRLAADCDGDGTADVVVGAPHACAENRDWCGRVDCLSGKTGKPLWSVSGPAKDARLGKTIAVAPDLDGDGAPEIVAGAPFPPVDPDKELQGQVLVLSGRSGKVLRRFEGGWPGGRFGSALATSRGEDPLLAIGNAEGAAAEIYSLRDGKLRLRID